MVIVTGKLYACKFGMCNIKMKRRRNILLHRQAHHRHYERKPEGPYQCEFCGKQVLQWLSFVAHIQTDHVANSSLQTSKDSESAAISKYKCELCHATVKGGLRNHFEFAHNLKYALAPGDRQYKCDLFLDAEQTKRCNAKFYFEISLQDHYVIDHKTLDHRGECPLYHCREVIFDEENLILHLNSLHKHGMLPSGPPSLPPTPPQCSWWLFSAQVAAITAIVTAITANFSVCPWTAITAGLHRRCNLETTIPTLHRDYKVSDDKITTVQNCPYKKAVKRVFQC